MVPGARRGGGGPVVAVTGCVAQQEGRALLERGQRVDLVVGTQALSRLPAMVEGLTARRPERVDVNPYDNVSFPLGVARRSNPVAAAVTVIEGCNDFCAFCVVPYTRGHERMRPAAEIVAEVRHAADGGHREVHLLGQIVNHYTAPDRPSCDFAGLLELVNDVPGIERIRFASPHPRHVTDSMIAAMRTLPKVCPHLHLPIQSGSTAVLARMRRRHTRDDYLRLVDKLRAAMPDIALSTDVIVGFPGETDRDFEDTLSLARHVGYHSMFSFKYSERPNTLASKRLADDVPPAEKTRRIVALQEMQKAIQSEIHRRRVGDVVEVLVDSTSPSARRRVGRPHRRQHRRQFPRRVRRGGVRGPDGPPRQGAHHRQRTVQPPGRVRRSCRYNGRPRPPSAALHRSSGARRAKGLRHRRAEGLRRRVEPCRLPAG